MSTSRLFTVAIPLCGLALAGCLDAEALKVKEKPEEPPVVQQKPAAKPKSILKQKTQEIAKYDPAAGRIVSDSDVEVTNPITGPLEAYGPMVEQISKLQIDQMVTLYKIEHDRTPTYDEFMKDIIKRNNVWLPVLPAKMEYQYDEKSGQLVVVYPLPKGEAAKKGDGEKVE